jgi:hypothetical protein
MVVVSGLYDCWNESQGLPYIEIDVCYHPDQEYFFVDLIDWPRLAFDLAECVCHEWIHQQQHHSGRRYRRYSSHHPDPETRSEQEYLGSEDEIDAYGFSIAADSVVNETHWQDCEMYQVYQRVFEHDPNIIVKLQKEIVKYLKRLEQDHARQISRNTRS